MTGMAGGEPGDRIAAVTARIDALADAARGAADAIALAVLQVDAARSRFVCSRRQQAVMIGLPPQHGRGMFAVDVEHPQARDSPGGGADQRSWVCLPKAGDLIGIGCGIPVAAWRGRRLGLHAGEHRDAAVACEVLRPATDIVGVVAHSSHPEVRSRTTILVSAVRCLKDRCGNRCSPPRNSASHRLSRCRYRQHAAAVRRQSPQTGSSS